MLVLEKEIIEDNEKQKRKIDGKTQQRSMGERKLAERTTGNQTNGETTWRIEKEKTDVQDQ